MKKVFNESSFILIIKILDIAVSFVSLFYITSNLSPALYSLVGIRSMYNSIMMILSNVGAENIFMRNYLYWKKMDMYDEIDFQYSLSFTFKIILGPIILILPIILSVYYWIYKYNSNILLGGILIYYSIISLVYSFTSTYKLILMGTGNFISIYLGNFYFLTIHKLIIICLFKYIGDVGYLILFPLGEVFLIIFYRYKLKKLHEFRFSIINVRILIDKIKELKNYIKENYINFVKQYLDKLLTSILLRPEVFATYNLAIQIEDIFKSIIESFFDPLVQKTVKYKNDNKNLVNSIKKINKHRLYILTISIIGIIIYIFIGNYLIKILGLDEYDNLYKYILFVMINAIIIISCKIEGSVIALFYNSKFRVCVSFIGFLSIIPFVFIKVISDNNIIVLRTISQFINSVGMIYIYYSTGQIMNKKNICIDNF